MSEQLPSDELTLAERGIKTRKPKDELERQLAIVVCRMNTYRRPLDNSALTDTEMKTRTPWATYSRLVPHEVFLWMWNFGRDQWDKL